MLGSLDCMHWRWKNCSMARANCSGPPTVILEAFADYDLWIYHTYISMSGSNNDINVLETSHLFFKLAEGFTLSTHYVI